MVSDAIIHFRHHHFMAKAFLEVHFKQAFADGSILEMTVWRLPATDIERPHGLKYSLFYGRNGKRIVAYDNERGKGDHRHLGPIEQAYAFSTLEQLISDFQDDVRGMRQRK
jgi:hypothetical protein